VNPKHVLTRRAPSGRSRPKTARSRRAASTSQALPTIALAIVVVLGAFFLYGAAHDGRVSPGVRASAASSGGPDAAEARRVPSTSPVVDDARPLDTPTPAARTTSRPDLTTSAPLTLHAGTRRWTLSRDDIAALVATSPSQAGNGTGVKVDESRLRPLIARIAKEIDTPGTNARFDFKGGALRAIVPGKAGVRLDQPSTIKAIEAQLPTPRRDVQLPLVSSKAAFDSRDAAALAVGSVISTASTTYGDTIPNRRFNVELAASRLNGTVVAPGDVFSLNGSLGEVSYRSGYKQAYGITESANEVETIPSEGGGICQVATTLFHAVFWAGYPVVERNWHLYWIPRYGLPPKGLKGLDATIDQIYDKNGSLLYSVDFRFKNNTGHPLLIQAHTNGQQITVSLYGIKPTWQVRVSDPKITNVVKTNPSPVSEPTSSLSPGQKLMVEEAEDGFTATIVRQVVQNGKVVDAQTFHSVYQPSRNVWLLGASRGTKAVSGSVAPADRPANVPPTSSGAR